MNRVVARIAGCAKALFRAALPWRAKVPFRATATAAAASLCLAALVLAFATHRSLKAFPSGLDVTREGTVKPVVLARDGTRLSVTLQNAWNTTDIVPLQDMPEFLK